MDLSSDREALKAEFLRSAGFGDARRTPFAGDASTRAFERLHVFVFEPRALALHAALLAVACLVAAAYPALLAARLPIAATLRKETLS